MRRRACADVFYRMGESIHRRGGEGFPGLHLGRGVFGLCVLVMLVPVVGLAQRATASATTVLVLRVPPRGRLIAPKQLSYLSPLQTSGANPLELAGLFDVGLTTTRGTGNGILTAEWSSGENRAGALCSLDSIEVGFTSRPPSRLAELARRAAGTASSELRIRLRWDPQLPYRDQWASVSPPRLPLAGDTAVGGTGFPALRGHPGPAELLAEQNMARGVATPWLTVGPGQTLVGGRFFASIALPDAWSSPMSLSPVLTLTVTEY